MKEDQRIILTKRLLKEGLLKLLEKKDISKITVTELCEESSINRATFYRHYQTPRDIITEIRHDLFDNVMAIKQRGRQHNDVLRWLEDMCQYFYENKDLLKVMFRSRSDEEFVSMINEMYTQYFGVIRRSEMVADLDDVELKLTAYCFAGGVYYTLRQWILENNEKTPKEIAKVIYRFLVLPQ